MRYLVSDPSRGILHLSAFLLVVIMMLIFLPLQPALAAINPQIPFSGSLKDADGAVVADASYDIVFRLYSAASGGSALWTGTHTASNGNAVLVDDGVFRVLLGSGTGNSLSEVNFNSDTLYLGITVGTDAEMTPRYRLGAAAYAFNADAVDGLSATDFIATTTTQTVSFRNGIGIASSTPGLTTNTLYNLGGVLYWNGSSVQTSEGVTTLNGLLDVNAATTTGSLLYWNGSAWDDIATSSLNISTSNLVEGTALFWTVSRFAAALAGTSTSALAEGTNLYYTDARVASYIGGSSTVSRLGQTIDLGSETIGVLSSTSLESEVVVASEVDTESELEALLSDVSDVFTDNDGSLSDDNLGNNNLNDLADVNAATSSSALLYWNGSAWDDIATTSLGLLSTNVAEGTNLYWTNDRFDTRLGATTSLPGLTTLSGLTAVGQTGGLLTVTGNAAVLGTSSFATTTAASSTIVNLNSTNILASVINTVSGFFGGLSSTNATTTGTAAVSGALVVTGNTTLGMATTTGLTVTSDGLRLASAVPAQTTNRLYNSSGTLFWDGSPVAAFSRLSNAAGASTLDNTLHSQTWNWSTLSTGTALTLNASSLTTGALLSLNTASGDTALSVLGNILPTTAPTETTSTSTTVTDLDTGVVGGHISATLGTDGFPVIAYFASAGGDLKVVKCGNAACSSGNTITNVDSTNNVGRHTDISIGTDGFPIISYHDTTNGDLKVVKCGNAACSSGNTITTIDSSSTEIGTFTSLAIGTDGLPVISYFDVTNGNLKVMKCGNAACSSGNSSTTPDSVGNVGLYTSLAVGTDGFPVISYFNGTNAGLKVVKCGDSACTTGNTITTLDSTNGAGLFTSLAIGADGMPVVAYYNGTSSDLMFLKCTNLNCTSGSTTTVQAASDVGSFASVAMGVDGLPIIAYEERLAEEVVLVKCANAACDSTNNFFQTLADSDPTGTFNALLIATDGSPFVATRRGGFDSVRVTKFSSTFATGINGLSLFSGGADIGSQASYFNNVYAAQLWGKRLTVANFDLAENYAVADRSLGAGDAVALNADGKLVKAGSPEALRTLGVISTAPGLLLSNWEGQDTDPVQPVALAGRVPVKLATGAAVVPGDALAISELESGRVRKASVGEASVGYVLSSLDNNRVEMFVQLSGDTGLLVHRLGTSTASVLMSSSITELASAGALSLEGRFQDVSSVLETLGSSTAPVATPEGDQTFLGRVLGRIALWLADASNGITKLFAQEVRTEKLCIGTTCVSEDELRVLLKGSDDTSHSEHQEDVGLPVVPDEAVDGDLFSQEVPVGANVVDLVGVTDDVVPVTESEVSESSRGIETPVLDLEESEVIVSNDETVVPEEVD
jgi:hypothetical protein